MGGVGDTRVKANNEVLCLMDLVDGSKQLVHGLTVDKITGTFPTFSLAEVAKELKASAPNNKELQNLKGDVDILLGIRYLNCHPVLVHALANGLSIFRVRLTSHDGYNAVIGGPHQAFNYLARKAGNTNQLVAAFASCISDIRACGEFVAPKISSKMMTIEEEAFARAMNKGNEYDIMGDLEPEDMSNEVELFNVCLKYEDIIQSSSFEGSPNENLEKDDGCILVTCSTCGTEVTFSEENAQNVIPDLYEYSEKFNEQRTFAATGEGNKDFEDAGEENVKEMRKVLKILESGVNIEYRCIKCRS